MAPLSYLSAVAALVGGAFASDTCSASETCAEDVALLQARSTVRAQSLTTVATMLPEIQCTGTFEAEDATLRGAVVHANTRSPGHQGFTGSSFVDYINRNNDKIEWTIDSCSGGSAVLEFRYALAGGNRPLKVKVNGETVERRLSFPATGNWATWGVASVTVQLQEGTNVVKLKAAGSSGANVDSLSISPAVESQCFGTYEAEEASINGGVVHANTNSAGHQGFTGSSFVDYLHPNDDYVEWTVNSCSGGAATLEFRYALARGDRPLKVKVNGETVERRLSFPATGNWATWGVASVNVHLQAGANVIKLKATGSSGANMDSLAISPVPESGCTGTLEAEDASLRGAVVHANTRSPGHQGFTGSSFVDYINANDDKITWTVDSCTGGAANLEFRYALARGNRPLKVKVNGEVVEPRLSFPATGSWATWGVASVAVQLQPGTNVVKLKAAGSSGANMDSLTISR